MSGLFIAGDFTLNSGKKSAWKIECDNLSDEEVEVLAKIAVDRIKATFGHFGHVHAIPRGGLRAGKVIERYASDGSNRWLIVDDVMTTGGSLWRAFDMLVARGIPSRSIGAVVLFRRGHREPWMFSEDMTKQLFVASAVTVNAQ